MTDTLGKTYKGQTFVPIKTAEQAAEEMSAAAAGAANPDSVSIQVWMSARGVRDPVLRAGMLAFTKVRLAPAAEFDRIFQGF